ncbi:hypothetical protein ES708_05536 [subsurface metagenome]
MTIDEAIKTSQEVLRSDRLLHWPDAQDAITLGWQALKQIKEAREYNLIISEPRLPGETED